MISVQTDGRVGSTPQPASTSRRLRACGFLWTRYPEPRTQKLRPIRRRHPQTDAPPSLSLSSLSAGSDSIRATDWSDGLHPCRRAQNQPSTNCVLALSGMSNEAVDNAECILRSDLRPQALSECSGGVQPSLSIQDLEAPDRASARVFFA